MIFVTVGTHEQPFNRLIKKIDELKQDGTIEEDVIIQTGFSTYQRKTTMIGHSTGRRITMKPLFPEKFLMQPIICGHPAIIQRKTDPCPC